MANGLATAKATPRSRGHFTLIADLFEPWRRRGRTADANQSADPDRANGARETAQDPRGRLMIGGLGGALEIIAARAAQVASSADPAPVGTVLQDPHAPLAA